MLGKHAKSNPQILQKAFELLAWRATTYAIFEVQCLSSIITIQPRFGWDCSRGKTENKSVSNVNDGIEKHLL